MILQGKKASKKAPPGKMHDSTGQNSKQKRTTRENA